MTLTLETRAPIVVLVAQFNPAIFSPQWIARHLFDKAEGETMQVQILEMVSQSDQSVSQITFFEGVGIGVVPGRTELFSVDGTPETFGRVEAVLLKMLEVLPHTPLSAIGCNFNYIDDEPSEEITKLFETPEGLEGEGQLNLRRVSVQLQLEAPEVLNFTRAMTSQDVRFSFNYHRPESAPARYKEFVPGMIAKALAHSEELLKSIYGYDGHDAIGFKDTIGQIEAQQKGEDHAPEDAN